VLLAVDLNGPARRARGNGEYFIDVEGVAIASVLAFQSARINGSEFYTPEANRFSGYSDKSLCQQIFDIMAT